jgi:hypothetical protein
VILAESYVGNWKKKSIELMVERETEDFVKKRADLQYLAFLHVSVNVLVC